jgi:hypothetical protein
MPENRWLSNIFDGPREQAGKQVPDEYYAERNKLLMPNGKDRIIRLVNNKMMAV